MKSTDIGAPAQGKGDARASEMHEAEPRADRIAMPETAIAEKMCNVLIPAAEADLRIYSAAARALGIDADTTAIEAVLMGFRKFYGGLWVGGTVRLMPSDLTFSPNAINRAVHTGDYSLSIPLADILELAPEFGVLSGIVRIATRSGTMRLRCFGAKAFARRIKERCPNA